MLSGGGARGAAHIGVLKVLEELEVPIHAIAGTSMGAVVGGLYASGLSAAEVERIMRSLNWQEAFSARPPRRELSFRRREEDRNFLVRFPLGLRGGEFLLPKGLIPGQQLNTTLRRLTAPVAQIRDFDDLPTRFRALATDLETGDGVVLEDGDLTLAMRASVSAPGVFTPVEYQGRVLVDGGLAENVPIDMARAMGVDVLIVVDVGFPLALRDRLTTVPSISNQMLAILIQRNSARQRATLGPNDILIDPALGEASSFDFSRFGSLIDLGVAAARDQTTQLAKLATSSIAYDAYQARRTATRAGAPPQIDFVRAEPESQRYARQVQALFGDQAGRPLDGQQLDRRIRDLYGLGNLEVLDYRLMAEDERTGLDIVARRNSWGPNYVRFGLSLSDDFEGNSSFNASARFVLAEITARGGEWVWDLQVGESPLIATEVYLPLTFDRRWFISPELRFEVRNVPLFDAGARLAEYRVRNFDYGADFGREFGQEMELRIGWREIDGNARIRLGDPTLPEVDFEVRRLFTRASYDTLDNVGFPRRGTSLTLEWRDETETRFDADATLYEGDWLVAHSRGRYTGVLWTSAGINAERGAADVRNLFTLGGLFNLSGLAPQEIAGANFAIARVLLYRQIGRGGIGLFDVPAFLGISYEAGNVWADRGDISFGSTRRNSSLFLGLDTLLGPVYLGAGFEEGGGSAYYLLLGRSF